MTDDYTFYLSLSSGKLLVCSSFSLFFFPPSSSPPSIPPPPQKRLQELITFDPIIVTSLSHRLRVLVISPKHYQYWHAFHDIFRRSQFRLIVFGLARYLASITTHHSLSFTVAFSAKSSELALFTYYT